MSVPTSAAELHSVMLATDFSPASEKPLRHALAIAQHYKSKFYVAHVISPVGLTIAGPDAVAAAGEAVSRDAVHLENELTRRGALDGLQHQFIIRQGEAWQELEQIISQEQIDLVVIGTHGRRGMGKLLLGSVAEQIFRHAKCPVLTVGPRSYDEARLERSTEIRPFLFATDFGRASLRAIPYAISFANQFAAKLVLLHVVPGVSIPEGYRWFTADDVVWRQEYAQVVGLRRLEQLVRNVTLGVTPEFLVESSSALSVSEIILKSAENLRADVIIMGLHRSTHIGTASHMPWATAYDVVCGARCPVLTVRKEARIF